MSTNPLRYLVLCLVVVIPGIPFSSHSWAAPAKSRVSRTGPPRVFLNTARPQQTGSLIRVFNGDDFQSALDQAQPGDTIELEAGASFVGNFRLPKKQDQFGSGNGPEWIVIQSSARERDLPPEGTRISPDFSPALPKLISPNSVAAVTAAPGAHHYRFTAIEFTMADDVTFSSNLIRLGEGNEREIEELPRDIVIDRCYIHGSATANLRRGVALNSASTSIIDSFISEVHEDGADSQAICGWNGPGPFRILNNFLEAAGENVMFGGADPKIPELVPSDIEFRRNHCFKPLRWNRNHPSYDGSSWSVKNLFELKNARRVLIEGNLFENVWPDAQTGYAVLFKSVNQDGTAPWSVTEDVEFINNVIRHCASGLNIQGRAGDQPGGKTSGIVVRNNLFEDVGISDDSGEGAFLKITETEFVTVDHNTAIQSGNMIIAYGEPSAHFVFTNNVLLHNAFGIKGDGTGIGNNTLDVYFPDRAFKRNVIVGSSASFYPPKNFFPDTLEAVGFVDKAAGNYRLANGSRYKKAGTKGTDIGANIDAIEAAIFDLQ